LVRGGPVHSSRDFETELKELRAHLLAMGARCERIVGLAFEGFRDHTSDLMPQVTALDVQIDRDELEIHALILRILALRQPVADDLRFLAAALRLITDLERVGDEAVNIAERAVEEGHVCPLVVDELGLMAAVVREMLHLAIEGFVTGDDARAAYVLERDDDVDTSYASIIRTLTGWMSDHPGDLRCGLCAIRVAKYLERIADHATNVAEADIFMVRGEDVRHGQWRSADKPPGTQTPSVPTGALTNRA
jgi:phosphate transport system protein